MSFVSPNGLIVFDHPTFRYFGAERVELPVSELPRHIAISSRCVCGDALTLTDHSFTRRDDITDFEAVFACQGCTAAATFKVKRFLASTWAKTRKVEAGVTGIKYEKEG